MGPSLVDRCEVTVSGRQSLRGSSQTDEGHLRTGRGPFISPERSLMPAEWTLRSIGGPLRSTVCPLMPAEGTLGLI